MSDHPAIAGPTQDSMGSEDVEMGVLQLRTRGGDMERGMGMEGSQGRGELDIERDATTRSGTGTGAILEVRRHPLIIGLRSPMLWDVEPGDRP